MEEQLMETIEAFEEEFEGEANSPAHHHLFYVTEDAKLLDENKKEFFHSVTAEILHIVKWGCPDLETLVSFLKIRVTKINVEDCKKLNKGMKYVKNKIKYKRITGAKKISDLYRWIDATYVVYNNM